MEEAKSQVVRHECIVHKANVPLAAGESLQKYSQQLSTDGGLYIKQKLGLNSLAKPSYASAYMIEAYSDKCIFDVYKGGDGQPSEYKYYALEYSRKNDGKFEFKNLTEVERVTTYQAKQSLALATATNKAKAKKGDPEDDLEDAEEDDEEEETMAKKPAKSSTKKTFSPGWEVKKSANIWGGLI
jgi:hypothetical protein